jgi:uncharacterized RDD family membrane protein YckC
MSRPTDAAVSQPDDLVTGEAVTLDLPAASFVSRALALSLDALILIAVLYLTSVLLLPSMASLDLAMFLALLLIMYLGVLVGIPVTVETLTRGYSVGKLAAGLRVVRDDGGPIRFRHALIRGLTGVIELYSPPFYFTPALVSSLMSKKGKRIGDRLAGTYVIRVRGGRFISPVLVMPPELASWAVTADLGRIPSRLALAINQFLHRMSQLSPMARQQLAVRLADQAVRFVAPPPPPGTYPERFLMALLTERYRRDLARIQGAEQKRRRRAEQNHAASPLSATSSRLIGE